MRVWVRVLALVACAIGCGAYWGEVGAGSYVSSSTSQHDLPPERLPPAFEEFVDWPLLTDDQLIDVALATRTIALGIADPNSRAVAGCRALHALRRVLQREPHHARALVLAALLQHVFSLSPDACASALSGSVTEVALRATTLQPRSTGVAFAAALVLLGNHEEEKAYPLLNMMLRYGTSLEPSRQKLVEQVLARGAPVNDIIPPVFPQVLVWSYRIKSQFPAAWRKQRSSLALLQSSGLEDLRRKRRQDEFPEHLYQQYIIDLLSLSASDAVRSSIDRELAELCSRRSDRECATFFRARSELQQLALVSGYRPVDSRPARGSLLWWGSDVHLALDERHVSVGFFLPPTEGLEFIVVESRGARAVLTPSMISVFASHDNLSWKEVALEREPQRIQVRQQVMYALEPRETNFRFWKVNFRDARVIRSFTGSLSGMVSAYGNTTRGGGP